eukprot:CAMPEP_0114584898 /NCGR_PEP_ID=MMETSP0125-20121206/8534_1 /TAXON_ID=485358 ORGANISM="Aristerostoma sp., Strain ATCC 50986" /NCGR_SAMPLE_ID=MMETSP0125 /ASSEMBLY_ACC=CAM_ASM_000245 /LENGTH=76 /DNA_ID=CAMNT_0001779621 /DNA_START=1971 /DNA_END=2201 /DNA_ORIENTATION=-
MKTFDGGKYRAHTPENTSKQGSDDMRKTGSKDGFRFTRETFKPPSSVDYMQRAQEINTEKRQPVIMPSISPINEKK